jgi:ferrous iron transport protein B
MGDADVVDTPGVYGVSSFNDEERVARDVILEADTVVNVVDAVHLERDLFLTLQLIDMGKPMVVALNMIDEARATGVDIDTDLLSDLLGVPVIETVAVRNQGIDELKQRYRLGAHRPQRPRARCRARRDGLPRRLPLRGAARLEADEAVAGRHGIEPADARAVTPSTCAAVRGSTTSSATS